jgi:SOS-response transcriptional repressor LexA
MTLETETPIAVSYPFVQATMSERRRASGSAKRTRIFDFIVAYKQSHDGNSPVSRQIAEACNICSTSVVHYHLRELEKTGKIRIVRGSSRQILVRGGHWTYKEAKAHAPD